MRTLGQRRVGRERAGRRVVGGGHFHPVHIQRRHVRQAHSDVHARHGVIGRARRARRAGHSAHVVVVVRRRGRCGRRGQVRRRGVHSSAFVGAIAGGDLDHFGVFQSGGQQHRVAAIGCGHCCPQHRGAVRTINGHRTARLSCTRDRGTITSNRGRGGIGCSGVGSRRRSGSSFVAIGVGGGSGDLFTVGQRRAQRHRVAAIGCGHCCPQHRGAVRTINGHRTARLSCTRDRGTITGHGGRRCVRGGSVRTRPRAWTGTRCRRGRPTTVRV